MKNIDKEVEKLTAEVGNGDHEMLNSFQKALSVIKDSQPLFTTIAEYEGAWKVVNQARQTWGCKNE